MDLRRREKAAERGRRRQAPHLDVDTVERLGHEGRNALQELQAGVKLLGPLLADRSQAAEILTEMEAALRRLNRVFEELGGPDSRTPSRRG